jgi:hypothetical protein
MAIRLFTYAVVERVVQETGLQEAEVLAILKDQVADIQALRDWVAANEGATAADALANAWLPAPPPANAQAVALVAVALRLLVRVG